MKRRLNFMRMELMMMDVKCWAFSMQERRVKKKKEMVKEWYRL